jgi:voltage-gated sodium channel
MGAEVPRPQRYFHDPWNVFDFAIVAAAFLPVAGEYITVLRLLRLLRVLRLVRALPKLQILVSALLKAVPSMAYVTLLLGLVFYVYGVAAVFLFGKNDPVHFGNLQIALLSLFRGATLEDWTDLMYIQMYGCAGYGYEGKEALCVASQASPALGAAFFVSFVLIGTMIVLNLFVGVIVNGMEEAQAEEERREAIRKFSEMQTPHEVLQSRLQALSTQLEEAQLALKTLVEHSKNPESLRPAPRGTEIAVK